MRPAETALLASVFSSPKDRVICSIAILWNLALRTKSLNRIILPSRWENYRENTSIAESFTSSVITAALNSAVTPQSEPIVHAFCERDARYHFKTGGFDRAYIA